MTKRLGGIYPMQYAFYDRTGALDEALMRRQVNACVAAGAHGIAVLGLATEVNKLSVDERHAVLRWMGEEIGGRVPLAVTIAGATVEEQLALARHAVAVGASWLILQPPPERGRDESYYAQFFSDIMARVSLPVGIQNAPEYTGIGLSVAALRRLVDRHENFVVLKGEGAMLTIRAVIEALGDKVSVFNGRGGLELVDCLRAGCAGMIPATDTFDYQARIFELMQKATGARAAERLYEQILPEIVFTMQSLDSLLCYAKRIAAWRLGVDEVFDRAPGMLPTPFGLEMARRYADQLGPLP